MNDAAQPPPQSGRPPTAFFCGVDLHKTALQVCVLDAAGREQVNRRLPACGSALLDAIAPFRPHLELAVESTAGWYWVADLCEQEGITFRLLHARAAMSGRRGRKCDASDARHLADLLRRGNPPLAYACPRPLRGARDLSRSYHACKEERTRAVNRLKGVFARHGIALPKGPLAEAVRGRLLALPDHATRQVVELTLDDVAHHDRQMRDYRQATLAAAESVHGPVLRVLRTVSGVGSILAAVIACEVGEISRFPEAKHLVGYAGLAFGPNISNGRRVGGDSNREGSALLKWAFHQAAGAYLRREPAAANWAANRYAGRPKLARAVMAARVAKAVYSMWKNGVTFDRERFASHFHQHDGPPPGHGGHPTTGRASR